MYKNIYIQTCMHTYVFDFLSLPNAAKVRVESLNPTQWRVIKCMLANKKFQSWLPICWQPIRCHVTKSLLNKMDFNKFQSLFPICWQPIRCHVANSLLNKMDFDMDNHLSWRQCTENTSGFSPRKRLRPAWRPFLLLSLSPNLICEHRLMNT